MNPNSILMDQILYGEIEKNGHFSCLPGDFYEKVKERGSLWNFFKPFGHKTPMRA